MQRFRCFLRRFIGTFGPYFIINIVDSELNKYPEWLHKLAAWLLYFHACLNPIVYGVMNTQFRQDYGRIFTARRARCLEGMVSAAEALTASTGVQRGEHQPPQQEQ